MKDSRTGAMGVVAIACVLLLKFASLASLPSDRLWPAVLLMPLAGRCARWSRWRCCPAAVGRTGQRLLSSAGALAAIGAIGVLAATSWGVLGPRGLIVWAACIVRALAVSAYIYRKLGGATGDTLGAVL